MLKILMRKASLCNYLFLLFLFLSIPYHSYSMEFSQLNKLYTMCYVQARPMTLKNLKKIQKNVDMDSLPSRVVWSRMMIQTLYAISLSTRKEQLSQVVNREIEDLVRLYQSVLKTINSKSKIHDIFFAADFAFDLALLRVQYKFKPSQATLLTYSSDMFRLVIFEDTDSQLAKRARVMLAIIKSYSADMSSSQWNSYVIDQLSDYRIDEVTNKRLKYQSYLYRALFYRKIGNPEEANRSLRIAETIFPKGKLVERIENSWKLKKAGMYVVR